MDRILIGKKEFKNSDDLNDWLSDSMADFLENITDYRGYTYPATGEMPLLEFEEGISFYYTAKGMNLVDRWKARMRKVYEKYVDYDDNFNPKCSMYKEF